MSDAPQSRTALLTAYADQTTGAISPQNGRDLILSVPIRAVLPWSSTTAYVANDVVEFGTAGVAWARAGSTDDNPASSTTGNWLILTSAAGPVTVPVFSVGNVSTGSPGSSAAVALDPSSNTSSVIFNFTIPQGPAGTGGSGTSWAGAWSSSTAYAAGQIVIEPSGLYIAIAANTSDDPSTSTTGSWLKITTAGTIPGSAPSVPTGLSATAGDTIATLSWNASSGTYTVGQSTTSGGPYTNVSSGITGTSYTATGLSDGSVYYFVVAASNPIGTSANSAQASVTPSNTSGGSALTGTLIALPHWYGSDSPTYAPSNVFDGDLTTSYSSTDADSDTAYVGLDLGTAKTLTGVDYCPRPGFGYRMLGGQFQVSTTADFSSGVTTVYTVTSHMEGGSTLPPDDGVYAHADFPAGTVARYVRYLTPTGGYCNVAELKFYGS